MYEPHQSSDSFHKLSQNPHVAQLARQHTLHNLEAKGKRDPRWDAGCRVKFLQAGCEEVYVLEVVIGSLCYLTTEEDLDPKGEFLQDHF